MQALLRLISNLSDGWVIALPFLAWGLVFGAILITMSQLSAASGGYGILDFEFGYSASRVAELFGSYGPEGMTLYARIQLLDLLNPAAYALCASLLTYRLWAPRERPALSLFPLLAALGDYAENITLFLLARSYPNIPEALVSLSSSLSLLKNGLMIVGLAPLVLGAALWFTDRLRRAG
jgi:hypothetical protein